ncbi:hypothetical protein HS048_06685 [Planomonospora sp. ID91781]|uniref:hypothetical protein n=1 Tax=Planomonospora sp. ID91781 TaxID=2738135 RepID=UPI0018C35B10|nr:hypothetical protein [Planomonospora sp. ID91781]MBG0820423.1 hypothetical protein [Planomonospora sp. ID91781]
MRPLRDADGIEVRPHRTVLHNSIHRVDDDLMVDLHAYGTRAPDAPVIYLARTEADDAAVTYLGCFERVRGGAEQPGLQ